MRPLLVLAAAALVLAGCGNRERTISESAAVDSMHRADRRFDRVVALLRKACR